VDAFEKARPDVATLFYTMPADGSKVSLVASSGTAKIDAKEWLQQVLQPLGGKGGGKPTKAQGSAGDTSKLGDVLDLATKFAQSKLQ